MENMLGWLGGSYLWVKAAHVIFTFFWMAGLFILPRYLVHQSTTAAGSAEDLAWQDRIRKLRRMILNPSIHLVWILGLMLAVNHGFKSAGWLHAKMTLVLLLSGYHIWMVVMARKMSQGARPLGHKALRIINEIPALFLILIVILVVVRPF